MNVDAIVLPGPDADAVRGAASAQAARVAADLEEALAGTTEWLWLLDGSAVPRPDALAELLAATTHPDLPRPSLVAGKVVLPDGSPDPAALPWPRLTNKDVALLACEHHFVSLRAARHGSLLVHREALRRHGPPRSELGRDGEDLEWTARILREELGLLAPASVAERRAPLARDPEADVRARAAQLRGAAWGGEEKLWFGFLLGQDVVRARSLRVARALAAGALRGR